MYNLIRINQQQLCPLAMVTRPQSFAHLRKKLASDSMIREKPYGLIRYWAREIQGS